MTDSSQKTPVLFILACVLAGIGALSFCAVMAIQPAAAIFKPLFFFTLALTALGTGEILNHPKEQIFASEERGTEEEDVWQRRRNVCGLGNLFDIVAILLFFIALGKVLSPH